MLLIARHTRRSCCSTAGWCVALNATWHCGTRPPTTSGCWRRSWLSTKRRRRSTTLRSPVAERIAETLAAAQRPLPRLCRPPPPCRRRPPARRAAWARAGSPEPSPRAQMSACACSCAYSHHETSARECPPGLAGSWGRPGRGRQNVVTPARSRVAKEMMGSLFEPKIIIQTTISDSNNWIPSPLYREHWSQICVKYVYIY